MMLQYRLCKHRPVFYRDIKRLKFNLDIVMAHRRQLQNQFVLRATLNITLLMIFFNVATH